LREYRIKLLFFHHDFFLHKHILGHYSDIRSQMGRALYNFNSTSSNGFLFTRKTFFVDFCVFILAKRVNKADDFCETGHLWVPHPALPVVSARVEFRSQCTADSIIAVNHVDKISYARGRVVKRSNT